MIKIQKRSNRTWAAERPPLVISPPSAKLRAEIDRIWVKPVSKQTRPVQVSSGRAENKKPAAPASSGSRWMNSQPSRASVLPPVPQRNRLENYPLVPKAPPQNGTASKIPLGKSSPRDTNTNAVRPAGSASSSNRNNYLRKEPFPSVEPRASNAESQKQAVGRPNPDQPIADKPAVDTSAKAPEEKKQPINQPVLKPTDEKDAAAERSIPILPVDEAPAVAPEEPRPTQPGSNASVSSTSAEKPEAAERTHSNGLSTRQPGFNGNGNGSRMKEGSPLFRSEHFSAMPVIRVLPTNDRASQSRLESPRPVENGRNDHAPAPINGNTSLPNLPVRQPVRNEKPAYLTGLEQLLKNQPDLPAQTAVLGVSEDGLPVLLDLNDPASGAILIVGEERERQLEMLHTAIASIGRRNSARSVQFLVLTCDPQAWKEWITAQGFERHCLGVENVDESLVREWILRLADWTEQRRLGQRSGPAVVLVMDTLSFLPRLEYDVRLNFDWMVREGPQAAIWPVAAVSTDLVRALSGRRMLRAFQTRILGFTTDPANYVQLFGLDEQASKQFNRPGEFAVQAGDQWLRFCLPEDR